MMLKFARDSVVDASTFIGFGVFVVFSAFAIWFALIWAGHIFAEVIRP
jgi:hypothetical protein